MGGSAPRDGPGFELNRKLRYRQAASVRRFNDLIPFRVHEVLLVSSPYDAFILQEDGHLSERMFFEYREISLSSAPRFTHAVDFREAHEFLRHRRFDLVLVVTGVLDAGVIRFARQVKAYPTPPPVAVLAVDRREASHVASGADAEVLDGFFVWNGDLVILLAMIKTVEDRLNVDHDVEHGNVRVMIMIEDSPLYYSSFLGVLFKELMRQSLSLYSEGLSELYRKMYMQSRPKVLHARSYEEGLELFRRYEKNVLAVICDVRIPRNGQMDPEAGLDFARLARKHDPELPLLLQSAEVQNRASAVALGAQFLDKTSPSLLSEIREFLSYSLGFGDFVFRTPDGREFDRARDLRELEEKLATIPEQLLHYHAAHNHVSIWLMARSEFELAEELRPKKVSDFPSIERLRHHLIHTLRENRERIHRGVVSDFLPDHFQDDPFSRIGGGYLGGKARGIAFLYQSLADVEPGDFAELPVRVPQTIVISTEQFDEFLERNDLREFAYECEDDAEIAARFLRGRLPEELIEHLGLVVDRFDAPLAIRSSSLLEDSMHQPLAGIYSTLMIPNRDPDPHNRLRELCGAVKLVYASTYFRKARSYLLATGSRVEEEKMGVIIQRVVGQQFERRFYPHFSGVAQSHNFYPIPPQKSEDGIVHVAVGLGRQVVDGGRALRFSPRHPRVMPQFGNPEALLDNSQRGFWALDLDQEFPTSGADLYSTLRHFDLEAAERDRTLGALASVYVADDQRLRDDLSLPGPRVITFNNILKHRAIALATTLSKVLEFTERGLACGVEVEFACDLGDWGRPRVPGRERIEPTLYLLQLRPLVSRQLMSEVSGIQFDRDDLVCASRGSLGHGVIRNVCDLVLVDRQGWQASTNRQIAQELGELNARLQSDGRSYVLIGPGRWGSADEWLGIPVQWAQISGARVIVEASPTGYDIDPSQGTHFFHNITAQGVGYLMLPPGADKSAVDGEYFLDWDWLEAQHPVWRGRHVKLLRFSEPLRIVLDGRTGRGLIGKPRG